MAQTSTPMKSGSNPKSFLIRILSAVKSSSAGHFFGPTPDPTASRVINSLGLMLAGDPAGTPLAPGAIQQFLTRAHLD